MTEHPIATWHRLVDERNPLGLDALLDEDAVFLSQVVHTPQVGRKAHCQYRPPPFKCSSTRHFTYVREIIGANDAMLEFETEIDGIVVNGVDIIKWNQAGKVIEFKVMLRPLKAINLIHQRMGAILQASRERGNETAA